LEMLRTKFVQPLLASALSAVVLLGGAFAAQSADLPSREAPSIYSPTPAFSWAGFYVGVNGGYAWGSQDPLGAITSKFDSASFNTYGGVFGGTFGAQMQQGHLVLGVESDIDWADITGSKTLTPTIGGVAQPFTVGLKADIDWTSTARLRIGWAQDNWLFYSTAGLALMGSEPHLTVLNGASCATVSIPNCSHKPLTGGIAAGLGVEYAFSPSWSTKLEYMFIGQMQGANLQNANMIRVGLNYRFGG
jgi:outer membrane immunogenic protein